MAAADDEYVFVPFWEPVVSYESTDRSFQVRVTARRAGGGRLYRRADLLTALGMIAVAKASGIEPELVDFATN